MALLSLIPMDDEGREVLTLGRNEEYVSSFHHEHDGELKGIEVGFHWNALGHLTTIATMGCRGEIYLGKDSRFHRRYCSFELCERDGSIRLVDRSKKGAVRLHSGNNPVEFSDIGTFPYRQAIIDPNAENILTLVRTDGVELSFRIVWHPRNQNLGKISFLGCGNPRDTERRVYLNHKIYYRGALRDNSMSTEASIVTPPWPPQEIEARFKDVETSVNQISNSPIHTIVNLVSAKLVEGGSKVEVVQENFHGSMLVTNLIVGSAIPNRDINNSLFFQMLKAVLCISQRGLVHQNIQPSSIRYVTLPGGIYYFQLTNFHRVHVALNGPDPTASIYRAPELFDETQEPTVTSDIWSLLATIIDLSDPEICLGELGSQEEVFQEIEAAAAKFKHETLRRMASRDPAKRPGPYHVIQEVFNSRPAHIVAKTPKRKTGTKGVEGSLSDSKKRKTGD